MPHLRQIAARLARDHLAVLGGFLIGPGDDLPENTGTLLLLGPAEPGFWTHVTAQPEFDGTPDPLDRWSRRVIDALAGEWAGRALFPFGDPPHQPFYRWALRSGRCHTSPVRLLVHDEAGLMVSFRGALCLPGRIALPVPGPSPCDGCPTRPCLAACPPRALTDQFYDLPACHGFLDAAAGADCMGQGCHVRRVCPQSRRYARLPEQSAYHMRQFHR